MKQRRWCAAVLGAILPVIGAVAALPAQAEAAPQPQLDSYVVTIAQPLAPTPPALAGCDQNLVNCGLLSVSTRFSHLEGLTTDDDQLFAQSNLEGTARFTRIYGCQTRSGHRVHKYDRKVVDKAAFLNTRRGMGFRIEPGSTTVDVTAYHFPPDAQPGNCPAKLQATQYALKISHLGLDLVDRGPDPDVKYHFELSGTWIWRGAVATIPR